MPSQYPTALDTTTTLSTAVNGLQTPLNGDHISGATTITVQSTAGAASAGYVTIDSEVIKYAGLTPTTLTGCTRGADSTAAAQHSSGVFVKFGLVADHHNALVSGLIAAQTKLGLNTNGASATSIDAGQLAAGSSAALTAVTTSGLVTGGTGLRDSLGIAGRNTPFVFYDAVGTGTSNHTINVPAGSWRALIIEGLARSSIAAANELVTMRFNADAGGNYDADLTYLVANVATWANNGAVGNATLGHVCFIPGATATNASSFGYFKIHVPFYANTVSDKIALIDSTWQQGAYNAAATFFVRGVATTIWHPAVPAAVSSVILTITGNWTASSQIWATLVP